MPSAGGDGGQSLNLLRYCEGLKKNLPPLRYYSAENKNSEKKVQLVEKLNCGSGGGGDGDY